MLKVDSNGRVVLPQELRERLGMTPGTEVKIYEESGTAVVEPEDTPEQSIECMDRLVAETASEDGETAPVDDGGDPIARKHRDAVRSGVANTTDE